jgi:hypothetical protein
MNTVVQDFINKKKQEQREKLKTDLFNFKDKILFI